MDFSNRSDAGEFASNTLAKLRNQRVQLNLPIKDFSLNNPTKVGLEWDQSVLGVLADPCNSYYDPDPQGLITARNALSQHLSRQGRLVDPDDLFLCASTSEAYSWLFKLLCNEGDAVLVPKPGYPLFEHLATLEYVNAKTL